MAEDREGMLRYAFRVVLTLIDSVRLRNRLLRILVSVFMSRPSATDSINVCQCLVLIDDPQATADILERLLLQSQEGAVIAYQVGFDLYENSTQVFLHRVSASLARSTRLSPLIAMIEKDKLKDKKVIVTVTSSGSSVAMDSTKPVEDPADKQEVKNEPAEAAVQEADPVTPLVPTMVEPLSEADKEIKKRLENLMSILSGEKVIELHLQFLIRNNKADLRLLERIREEVRHSVTHNATVLANGIMHCGTTSDQFLRDHLSWLGKAVNWAKFTATATLGVIHRGHEKDALRLMSAYLPKDASGSLGSVYTEGGGLFALGMIHANHGGTMTEYLLNQCKEATAEPVRHGACLGLGLAAMGTGREDVYEQMKSNLYQDDAVTSEAAGIGIGLVMLGTGSAQAIEDLLGYAKETAHEKIIRGIALGIAMVMYGRLEEADELIDRLIVDNDPILRWCGMATIAMAYCGTGNNKAVQRLLHAAVSDTNDDVRRWAVTALGFILFKTPDQVPALVSLLTESYHPHLRFGAAMAMGIACAGTALKDALSLLETLCDGTVAFVRQGALIATAMVLMQQNGVTCPKSVEFREKCLKIISDRHEDLLAKFGAILACGILDAGGCNMTISLQTRTDSGWSPVASAFQEKNMIYSSQLASTRFCSPLSSLANHLVSFMSDLRVPQELYTVFDGNNNMVAAVGLLLFQNFWFWYPLTNFLSLALTPTTLIALNKDLKMPKMQFRSNAKPSTFAYPQPLQPEKEKKREKVETAILSITAKQRKKEADRKQHKEQQQQQQRKTKESGKEEKMDVDTTVPETPKEDKPSEDKKEDKEPNFILLNNPARVMRTQQRFMALPETSRYYTIKPITQAGILMVHDRRPQETEVLVELVHGHGPTGGELTTVSSSAGGTGATAVSGSAGADAQSEPVHASSIGAYLDDDDDDVDDDVDDDDEDEDSSSDMHDDEDEDDDEEFAVAVVESLADRTDIEMGEPPVSSGSKKDKHKSHGSGRHGKGSSAPNVEPTPPEPFQFVEEISEPATTVAGTSVSGASSSGVTATITSSSGPIQSSATNEPMELETDAEKEEKKKPKDVQDSKDDTKK
ncbi:26S proteasome regulatory subunit N2 [Paragonimus westermani]|uniref:26S proteasome non-ATPase regulatory subunit 1 n=1 Tax=Paragonimus westermani TaxID=34504 RepID=A0A5J4NYB8_9TREM|nr:26S proteasome regulatory subunit N2 [Paragonimus westermani]